MRFPQFAAVVLLAIALSGCSLLQKLDDRTTADVQRDVIAADIALGAVADEVVVAKKAGLVQSNTPLATAITTGLSTAAGALTGANKDIQAGQIGAADLLYQTAMGAIHGLQTNVPQAAAK